MRRLLLALLLLFPSAPLLAQAKNPNLEGGFSPEKAYHVDDLDAINLFNLNVNAAIPLGQTYHAGGKLPYSFVLHYSGNAWESSSREYNTQPPEIIDFIAAWRFPSRTPNAGFGWSLSFGRLVDPWTTTCSLPVHLHPPGTTNYTGTPWAGYETEDGSIHCFYDTPHDVANESQASPMIYGYTRDGSYLRLRTDTSPIRVEFPDGTYREFGADGRVTNIRDRFGNWVNIAYNDVDNSNPIAPGSPSWTITDSDRNASNGPLRTHKVYFKPGASYAEFSDDVQVDHYVVGQVVLATSTASGNSTTPTYTLNYADLNTADSLIGRQTTDSNLSTALRVNVLTSIDLPSSVGGHYTMQIDHGLSDPSAPPSLSPAPGSSTITVSSGALRSFTLPTGGTVTYDYQNMVLPYPGKRSSKYSSEVTPGELSVLPAGVRKRTLSLNGKVIGSRSYTFDGEARTIVESDANNQPLSKSQHYFSTCIEATSCAATGVYGLPLTLTSSSGGLYLSSEEFGVDSLGNWTVQRRHWIKYEADNPLDTVPSYSLEQNRRVVAQATDDLTDGTSSTSTNSYFDGFGHYRQTVTGGTFGASNYKRTYTDFNASTGVFLPSVNGATPSGFNGSMLAAANPWLLELSTFSTVTATEQRPNATATTTTSKTYTCFDPSTGFLQGRRTVRALGAGEGDPPLGSHDLLALFTKDSHGNVASERDYGGDDFNDSDHTVSTSSSQVCANIGSDAYRIEHTYDTAGNLLSSQYYDGNGSPLTFKIVDRSDVDPATGLVRQSRAGATASDSGQVMNYKYDELGRLVSSQPVSGAWTDYTYSFSPPSVAVTAYRNNNASQILKQASYQYDGFGRLTKEMRQLADGVTSNRLTEYNHLGWKTRQSEWETAPTHYTVFSYDVFGRPVKVESPDHSKVTMSYSGVSSMSRTVSIGTDATATSTTLTDSTTTEMYDRQGRLWQVTEPDGVTTQYTHDVGGGLAHVCMNVSGSTCVQQRVFTRDGAGLLISEQHPEKGTFGNGTTMYKYDARGHVTNRIDGAALSAFDLTFAYDRAERPRSIFETRQTGGVNRILKDYSYATTNDTAAPDYANGKLRTATRFNWIDSLNLNVKVVETYTYGGVAGSASKRTTAEYECYTPASDQCNGLPSGTPARQFETSLTYDDLGSAATITNPACTIGCSGVPGPSTVTNTYDQGMLKKVNVGLGDNTISYSENGMLNTVTHSNGVLDTQTPDPTMMPRPANIAFTNAVDTSTCTPPTITTNPQPVAIVVPNSATLTPAVSADANTTAHPLTYQWYVGQPGNTAQTAPNGNNLSLTVSPTVTTSYWLRVQNGCGSVDTLAAVVSICTPPTVTTNPTSTTITRGQSKTLEVSATGTAPSYQWYEGQRGDVSHPIAGANDLRVTVSPQTTTSYWVALQNACGGYQSLAATLTVVAPPTTPQNVVASWDGFLINLTWSASTSPVGIQYYQIQRAGDGSVSYTNYRTADHLATRMTDNVPFMKAYAYKVIAVDNNGIASSASVPDGAVAMTFTDDPLVAKTTRIRGVHFSELWQAVDAMRAAAGVGPHWTSYWPLTGYIGAGTVGEIRQYLDLARSMLGLPPVTYRLTPLSGRILANDIEELRAGVR